MYFVRNHMTNGTNERRESQLKRFCRRRVSVADGDSAKTARRRASTNTQAIMGGGAATGTELLSDEHAGGGRKAIRDRAKGARGEEEARGELAEEKKKRAR